MAKLKRVNGKRKSKKKKEKEQAGPVKGPTPWEQFEAFMADWGRLVIPLGLAAILSVLRLTGVLDETGLGFTMGMLFMLAVVFTFVFMVFRNVFPGWVKTASVVSGIAVMAGAGIPFTQTVYPGKADFSATLQKDGESINIDEGLSGRYRLEVFASSMAEQPSTRSREGKYVISVAGQRIAGKFSDKKQRMPAGRRGSRMVKKKHLTDTYPLVLPAGKKAVKLLHLDTVIGPNLHVALFKPLITPPFVYLLLGLALLFGIGLDARYQEQTLRWRLAPWFGMIAVFLLIFERSYEKGSVSNNVVWSVIFGSAIGFTVGWAVSLAARKVVGSRRA
ncbi:MAG: hypothetical protein GXP54_06235 [Deltaproteobacteria bacterium]|nr:hypothetical protein [Deltaproteobacteria bacterium]